MNKKYLSYLNGRHYEIMKRHSLKEKNDITFHIAHLIDEGGAIHLNFLFLCCCCSETYFSFILYLNIKYAKYFQVFCILT